MKLQTRLQKLEAWAEPPASPRLRRVILKPREAELEAKPGELLIVRRLIDRMGVPYGQAWR